MLICTSGCANSDEREGTSLPAKGTANSSLVRGIWNDEPSTLRHLSKSSSCSRPKLTRLILLKMCCVNVCNSVVDEIRYPNVRTKSRFIHTPTLIHTHAHPHTYTDIHTNTQTYIHNFMLNYTSTYTFTQTHTFTYTYKYNV